MLASTVQFSSYGRPQPGPTACPRTPEDAREGSVPAGPVRDRAPLPHPPALAPEGTTTSNCSSRGSQPPKKRSAPRSESVPSGPNSVPRPPPPAPPRSHRQAGCTTSVPRQRRPTGQCSTREHHPESERLEHGSGPDSRKAAGQVLLRKEVIQPHLPVRLPCYDFVPIADPTFDSSLSCGLGHWLRVLPTFVT